MKVTRNETVYEYTQLIQFTLLTIISSKLKELRIQLIESNNSLD